MYHSINFSDTSRMLFKNTWTSWHLIPSSRPVVAPPSIKKHMIEIPGTNGILDLSNSLTGYPTYNNREGSFDFIVANGYADWSKTYSDISNCLHGREMTMWLEDDPNYYYKGMFSVSNWVSNSDGTWSNITIDYNVDPYKRTRFEELEHIHTFDGVVLKEGYVWYTHLITDLTGYIPTHPRLFLKGSGDSIPYSCTVTYFSEFTNKTITKELVLGDKNSMEFDLPEMEFLPVRNYEYKFTFSNVIGDIKATMLVEKGGL